MMDWDQYGYCVKCHKNMLIEEAIDGRIQKRLTAEYTERPFKLNDGSIMRVAFCVQCAESITHEQHSNIMNCVIKGWDRETDELVKSSLFPLWTQERKEAHMEEYRKKEIVEVV